MRMSSSLGGMVTVQLTGADLPSTLDSLIRQGIMINRCHFTSDLEAEITIARRQYKQLEAICLKRGDTQRLMDRKGAYWRFHSLWKRKVLLLGLAIFLIASLYLPTRVWFVRVTGNMSVPSNLIIESASSCGIRFGASRRAVRSEQVKNALLEAVPQLQWAGVNTYGCVAEISVRERSREEVPEESSGVGHVTAGLNGVIVSATATRGNLLCTPGQAVSAGDILISGYTDCGLTIRAEQAEGEVFAATRRCLTVAIPNFSLRGRLNEIEGKKISLFIGKKRINLWKDSGIWDATCDRMYEEYYITLPGGFQLPFGWSVESYRPRDLLPEPIPQENCEYLLAETAKRYLNRQMLSGTIRNAEVSFEENSGAIQMTGEYGCLEMIGFRQRLEIGETNGENN